MKIYILIVVMLGFVIEAPGQASNNSSSRQTPHAKSAELNKLRREFIKATQEYKVSLGKLLANYEKDVRKAEVRLSQAKTLYSQGLILKSELDVSARAVEEARQKVIEVTRRIAAANKQIADALLDADAKGSPSIEKRNVITLSDDRVSKIIAVAEALFRKGKLNLEAGKRSEARDDFDQAVDEILTSGIDVRASQELQTYYLELVERIYREEVPTTTPSRQASVIELVAQNGQSRAGPNPPQQIGFEDQKFKPSALDELSKLVLTPEEQTAGNDKIDLAPSDRTPSRKCNPTIIRAAQLRGFHLAMTVSQVRARLPRLKSPVADASGYARVSVHFNRTEPPPAFLKGVMTMVFDFIDGHVSYIGVLYDDSIKWKNLDQFTKQVANSLRIPEDWQSYTFRGEQQRMLQCDKLRFVAAMLKTDRTFSPGLFLVDDSGVSKLVARRQSELERVRKAEEERRQRKLQEEEERRKAFKP